MAKRRERASEDFFECIVANSSQRLLVVDQDLTIIYASPSYCASRDLSAEQIEGGNLNEFFPASMMVEAQLGEAIRKTLANGQHTRWSGYRQATDDHSDRVINIRLDPYQHDDQSLVLLTIEDITQQHRQLYERNIIQQISEVMLGIISLPRLLHAILTAITAGGAVGLGFNRAVLMLVDEEASLLKAEMAVGPRDAEQAYDIWAQMGLEEHHVLDDLLDDEAELPPPEEQPLYDLVQHLQFPLSETDALPTAAIARRETVHVRDARNNAQVSEQLYELLQAEEFIVAPLLVENQAIGALIASNFVTRRPIAQPDVHLLNTLANQAALAIDRARAYEEIQRRAEELEQAYERLAAAQKEKIEAEKLATIGEVTALVAHEIRNPMSTIGGFARSINQRPDDLQRVQRNSRIIIEEVERLEQILQQLLDFVKPPYSELILDRLEPLIDYAVQMTTSLVGEAHVVLDVNVEERLPEIFLDQKQCQQVMVNLIRNAMEAMPDGGHLEIGARRVEGTVELYVSDTGNGVRPEHLGEIFDTFYTTKPSGTGLGLALTQRIVHQHGAEIKVSSEEGKGSTFAIAFPIPAEQHK